MEGERTCLDEDELDHDEVLLCMRSERVVVRCMGRFGFGEVRSELMRLMALRLMVSPP